MLHHHGIPYTLWRSVYSPRLFASLRSAHRPHIKRHKNTQGNVNTSLGLFMPFYAWLVARLHSHLFCNFCCKVFFFFLNTFACFKTNEFFDCEVCAFCFCYFFYVFAYCLFSIFSFYIYLI